MIEFVRKEDLHIINMALNNNRDIRIQRTKDGYRIVEDTVKVLAKRDLVKDSPIQAEGLR
jgi:hypothetical protein|nr:MAG TPA: hypothetical protein [Caudoviricetes sp.]